MTSLFTPTRFTLADAERAHDEWGCNCGPGAIAAVCGLTLDEVRPFMGDFEEKGYTNPTLMFETLKRLGVKWSGGTCNTMSSEHQGMLAWPEYGLARIQWEGPWTQPEVPIRARYRYTHWVGACMGQNSTGIFDINCMNNGSGWVDAREWGEVIAPYLIKQCVKRGNGKWHLTHVIEVLSMPKNCQIQTDENEQPHV